jgi:hypothetical protein
MINNENTFLYSAFFFRAFFISIVFFVLSTGVLAAPLKDDETCKAGMDCTCGFVTCAEGTKCELEGSIGICSGPAKPIPTGIFSREYVVPIIIVVVVLGIYLLIQRRRKVFKK